MNEDKQIEEIDQTQAFNEGWCISYAHRGEETDSYEIQALNDAGIFENDSDAHLYLCKRAVQSDYHYNILNHIRRVNNSEYITIFQNALRDA